MSCTDARGIGGEAHCAARLAPVSSTRASLVPAKLALFSLLELRPTKTVHVPGRGAFGRGRLRHGPVGRDPSLTRAGAGGQG